MKQRQTCRVDHALTPCTPPSSLHRIDHLLMRDLVPVRLRQGRDTCTAADQPPTQEKHNKNQRHTSQIPHHILSLPKIHLLYPTSASQSPRPRTQIPTQQIPHLQLHILHQLPHIHNMAPIILHRHILLDLPRHIPTKIHIPQPLTPRAQMQYNRTRKLVVRRPRAINRLKNMYGVPTAPALPLGRTYKPLTDLALPRSLASKKWKASTLGETLLFFNSTTPANPSSRSQKYTLLTPPS